MRRYLSAINVVLWFALAALSSPSLSAGVLHFRLPVQVTISGDVIFLSHLLPPAAPEALRQAIRNFSLGAAPAPGSSRILSSREISNAFSSAGIRSDRLPEIPVSIAIGRAGTALTSADLVPLLTSALGSQQPIPASDISLPGTILLPQPPPALRILSIKPDPVLNATNVRLAPLSGKSVVPFDVLVRTRLSRQPRSFFAEAALAAPRTEPVLVDPQRLAGLSIASTQSHLLLTVRPLERGILGQTIRIRLPGTGKTFRATVVAFDSLEARLSP